MIGSRRIHFDPMCVNIIAVFKTKCKSNANFISANIVVKQQKSHIINEEKKPRLRSMKHLIFAVLENSHAAEETLMKLSKMGYNGTVIPSTSLKHTLENDGEVPMFVNLSLFEHGKFENNTTLYIVAEENQVEDVQNIIRESTKHFTRCRGGMFVIPLESYEGSF